MSCEALKQAGLARSDSEVVKLHLRLGPGARCRPLEGSRVAMLVDEVKQRPVYIVGAEAGRGALAPPPADSDR